MFSLSVAMDKNKGTGKNNSLPWHISEELKLFKANTINKHIVMGRKTYVNLPGKLSNRIIHVVTNNNNFIDNDVEIIHDVDEFINRHKDDDVEYVICGGSSIYKLFYPYCKKAYVSIVNGEYDTDCKFESFNFDDYKIIETVNYSLFSYYELEKK